jgi:hypothetical protein
MNAVWELPCRSHTAKLVLLAIANHADDSGKAWPSVERLAEKCSLTSRSVTAQLAYLEEDGLLVADRHRGKSTVYHVVTPERRSLLPPNGFHSTPERLSPLNGVHPERGSLLPLNGVHPTPERGSSLPLNDVPEPLNDVHPNHQEPSLESSRVRTLRDSPEPRSPLNLVHLSPLSEDDLEQIDRIVRAYPNSRGKTEAARAVLATMQAGISLDDIEAGTAAIAAVIAKDYTDADRLRFIVSANRFFEERRWQENPADWRLFKAVAREAASSTGEGGEWVGRVPE